jgi:hypothetical protein
MVDAIPEMLFAPPPSFELFPPTPAGSRLRFGGIFDGGPGPPCLTMLQLYSAALRLPAPYRFSI